MASPAATAVDVMMADDNMVNIITQNIMDLFFILDSLLFIRRRYATFAARGTRIQGHPGEYNDGNYKKHFHTQTSFCSGQDPAASTTTIGTSQPDHSPVCRSLQDTTTITPESPAFHRALGEDPLQGTLILWNGRYASPSALRRRAEARYSCSRASVLP